jgi:TRAP-type C4-dicarboxylate transport system substrate-binding protein
VSRTKAWAALLAVTMAAACQTPGTLDKTGSTTEVLRLATIDGVNDNGQSFGPQAFVAELTKVSRGRLEVQVTDNVGKGGPTAESDLVRAIAAGRVDGGWPSTRAFAAAGLDGLRAVEAPMTITSYAAEKELVSGAAATELLKTLDGSGLVALGLGVGPLRRAFAADAPLLEPADWKGIHFRSFNSPVQDATITALGGTPESRGVAWVEDIKGGRLQGVELDVAEYAKNGVGTAAGFVASNIVLWPKVFVFALSRKRFESLSAQEQAWVRQAANAAVRASVAATYDERTPVQQICSEGVRITPASDAQLAALRTALRPVVAQISADPVGGPPLQAIQAIARRHPDADALDATSCPAGTNNGPLGAAPNEASALPDGVYRVSLTEGEVARGGLTNDGGLSGLWSLTARHGTYEMRCRPVNLPGTDCGHEVYDGPLDVGDLRGTGRTVYFVPDLARLAQLTGCQLPPAEDDTHCFPGRPYRMTWQVHGRALVFTDYVNSFGGTDMFMVKPWRQIG